MSNTSLVYVHERDVHFLDTVGIPGETVSAVGLLIRKSQAKQSQINAELLEIAREITNRHPVYLCANFAVASLIAANDRRSDRAFEPLYRTWIIGERSIQGRGVHRLTASFSQATASFLHAGASLARYYVWKSKLEAGLGIADIVAGLDLERATSARFDRAHIHHLLGQSSAVDELHAIAREGNPMAFYALGLEQLRRRRFDDARDSFWNGARHAPEVAEILLGERNAQVASSPGREHEAQAYVETFCLSEWTASELGLLDKCLAAGDDQRKAVP